MSATRRRPNLTSLLIQYNGELGPEVLETFLASVNSFRNTEAIPDNEALPGIVPLLGGDAAVWWQRVGYKAKTWREFEARLRNDFAPKKPTYLIYSEMAVKQAARQSLEDFIARKRVLFAMLLPPNSTETLQLDMVYDLLNDEIKEKVPLSSITTIDELLEAAKNRNV